MMHLKTQELKEAMRKALYVCDDSTAIALFLAGELRRPVLVEGPAGVGKTEIARAYSEATGSKLLRLQCYEGLDETKALYEWNYRKQLLMIHAREKEDLGWENLKNDLFSEEFLLPRPLLSAITDEGKVVLLIDEVDKADVEFEAFLLEVLSDFQVSIPELGTLRAKNIPFVILTSNRTREISEALRRRCLYLYLDFPDAQREIEILRLRVPEVSRSLAERIVAAVRYLRTLDLRKVPSISETLDWARAIAVLGANSIEEDLLENTLSLLVKEHKDLERVRQGLKVIARHASV